MIANHRDADPVALAVGSQCRVSRSTPAWLPQIIELISDRCDEAFRNRWAAQLCASLARLDDVPPFRLIHDWHATTVSRLIIDSCLRRGLSVQEHEDVRELHRCAWRGHDVTDETWRRTLEPAFRAVFFHSYPYAEASATAADAANSYAVSHGYSAEEAKKYGETYATINTGANARLFSAANAKANSRAYARAFARSDHDLLARAYPSAYLRACLSLARTEHRSGVYRALAEGFIHSLAAATAG